MKRIYISDVVHQQLKKEAQAEGRTLQWVVESKLTGTPTKYTPPVNKNVKFNPDGTVTKADPSIPEFEYHTDLKPISEKSRATPDVSDLFKTAETKEPGAYTGELACCQNELQPCKHWVWDTSTGEGYKNSLSGRFMEVD